MENELYIVAGIVGVIVSLAFHYVFLFAFCVGMIMTAVFIDFQEMLNPNRRGGKR